MKLWGWLLGWVDFCEEGGGREGGVRMGGWVDGNVRWNLEGENGVWEDG